MPELLEDDIRATAPQPDPDFVARLERRVDAGFAKEAKPATKPARKKRSWFFTSGMFAPVAVCAVFALVVVGIGLSASGSDDDSASSGSSTPMMDQAEPDSSA